MTHDVLHDRDARNLPEGVEFGFDGLELRWRPRTPRREPRHTAAQHGL